MNGMLATVLGVGFVLGLRHALDPDHVVAVTTMASGKTGLVDQYFDNLLDPHTSFATRMGLIMTEIQTLCSLPEAASLCQLEHSFFHPHMPSTSTPLLKRPN